MTGKPTIANIDQIAINIKSFRIIQQILHESPYLAEIMQAARTAEEALLEIQSWISDYFESNPVAHKYYNGELTGSEALRQLSWQDFAAIRLMDYVKHAGRVFEDANLKHYKVTVNEPIKVLWLAIKKGTGGGRPDFFMDMLHLFRQFNSNTPQKAATTPESIKEWMNRHPSGLDPQMIRIRQHNKERIINIFIQKIDAGEISDPKFTYDKNLTLIEKYAVVSEWWNNPLFHLRFAIRTPELLNEMLEYSMQPEQMKILKNAEKKGIPIFVNPYYLSLLNTRIHGFAAESDRTIRDYILVNKALVEEFGHIVAWEKEDTIKPGEPNPAGYVLPNIYNVHRRYPEVAILIPDTVGRACGGLCVSCQRMFDFQRGHFNFDLEKLAPRKTWWEKLDQDLMPYFEKDDELRDILITGGDALMSKDSSLKKILDAIYKMALKKKEANKGNTIKKQEFVRIRIGTRLPVYLPQRITPELVRLLKDFKTKAEKIGFKQFFIQTHFVSAIEITPESRKAIEMLLSAGWVIINQLVFTAAASRRGHSAKLRQALNRIGVLPYYSFTVKGFLENSYNFAPNARSVQEMMEEKAIGVIPGTYTHRIRELIGSENIKEKLNRLRKDMNVPFLALDRNIMNLPGVGKSMTFRTIGITRYGKRILEFDYDRTRNHSQVIEQLGKVVIIESKSIYQYLEQMEELGEDIAEYEGLYGYSLSETEDRHPIFEYPK